MKVRAVPLIAAVLLAACTAEPGPTVPPAASPAGTEAAPPGVPRPGSAVRNDAEEAAPARTVVLGVEGMT